VLLLLGADFAWPHFYPYKAKIIQVDIDPTHIGRRHPVTIGAIGRIKPTLETLLPCLDQHENNAFLAAIATASTKTARRQRRKPYRPGRRISGTYLTKIINNPAAADLLFAADDGTAAV
jgi:pyruvate dehydrogenase (quinone)